MSTLPFVNMSLKMLNYLPFEQNYEVPFLTSNKN